MKFFKRSLPLFAFLLIGALSFNALALSADSFTDAADIRYPQAVQTLTQLGVIDGKDDGSFDPGGPVTRAEAAKLLTFMVNGGKDNDYSAADDSAAFSDVQGHWAQDQIGYCCSKGIVSGRSDSIFDPDAEVTVSEFAKMALTALGYDSRVFSLVGADWDINTNVCANQAGLYEGLTDFNAHNPLHREMAAQILYNTLNAQVMASTEAEADGSDDAPVFQVGPKFDEAGQPVTFLAEFFSLAQLPPVPEQP